MTGKFTANRILIPSLILAPFTKGISLLYLIKLLDVKNSSLTVDKKSITFTSGMFLTSETKIPMTSLIGVQYHSGFAGDKFKFGQLILSSCDSKRPYVINNIQNGQELSSLLEPLAELNRERYSNSSHSNI